MMAFFPKAKIKIKRNKLSQKSNQPSPKKEIHYQKNLIQIIPQNKKACKTYTILFELIKKKSKKALG